MVKRLAKKDLKNLKIVFPEEEPEEILNEEREDLTEEMEEDLENMISKDPYNQLNTSNFRRFRLRESNPSLEQNEINLERSIADIPINRITEDTTTRNQNNPSSTYLSTTNTENQTNPYSSNVNLYGPDNNTNNPNAYQSITGTGNTNITSLEQQRLNQTSINSPQNFIQNQQNSEVPKTEDPWGFKNLDKNVTNVEEAQRKEKQRRFYQ